MTSTPHTTCDHPATKAARAKCRNARRARHEAMMIALDAVIDSYYTNQGSCEGIAGEISHLSALIPESPSLREAAHGYYDESLSMEEIIALVNTARLEVA